jgi:uncharacterized membrane protein
MLPSADVRGRKIKTRQEKDGFLSRGSASAPGLSTLRFATQGAGGICVLTLIGIAIVIVGFVLRLNPLLVVTVAGIATGLAGGLGPVKTIEALGRSFTENRYVAIVWLVLPVIGLLERSGLKERTQELVSRVNAATTGRVLLVYLTVRQVTAALGLTSLGGHAQIVRPLVAPMAEAAAETHLGRLPARVLERIRAYAAATDNVGLFFGEDIFIAIGSILLIKGFLEQNGIRIEPIHLAVWAIPTAVAAFLIHGTRLLLLDRWLARQASAASDEPSSAHRASGVGRPAGAGEREGRA